MCLAKGIAGVGKAAQARSGARVVVVSTDGHKKAERIAFDDLNLEKPGAYKDCSTPFCTAYTQSKLANVMFAQELERRLPPGLDVAPSPATYAILREFKAG